jgi:acetyltransferase
VTADILADNSAMQRVCEKLGFGIEPTSEPAIVKVSINIKEIGFMV